MAARNYKTGHRRRSRLILYSIAFTIIKLYHISYLILPIILRKKGGQAAAAEKKEEGKKKGIKISIITLVNSLIRRRQ
jgi:hypothetical protein